MKRIKFPKTLTLFLMLIIASSAIYSQENKSNSSSPMSGISNEGKNLDKPYLTPGDRTYIVGTQNGNFPDLGSHMKGEMGGLWMPPIKLLDGFWVKLSDEDSGLKSWLMEAKEFVNYPYGNEFIYEPVLSSILVRRLQYCPQGKEGMVIKYTIRNASSYSRKLTMDFVVKTDVSPVWFSKENNILDAADIISWDKAMSVFIAKDADHPWFAVWGTSFPVVNYDNQAEAPVKTAGDGKTGATKHQINLKPNEVITMTFVVSGSNESSAKAKETYNEILKNYDDLLNKKKDYYATIMSRNVVEIPDKKLEQAYNWGKFNTEWLVSELPGFGRFLGAGAIEYPWLFGCDNSYALQGVAAIGDLELAKSTLRVIKNISEKKNGNGRIIHEMSSNGFVYNKGNTQETAHFAVAVWKVFEWTGDEIFLKEMYPYIKLGIKWLLTEQDKNKNMFPEGYGIMEVRGLNAELIDVAVYTQQALDVASKIAQILNESEMQSDYSGKAVILKDKINSLFWDDNEGSYCDFYGTREQAIKTTKGAIEQLQLPYASSKDTLKIIEKQRLYMELLEKFSKLPENTTKGWLTNKNWVISTPIEMGIAPQDKAIRLLDKVKNEHCGPFGPFLSALEEQYMMTIATGVQAMAEASYGRTDESLWYVDKIAQTFGKALPGSFSEMMPDYGCPVQAWTIYGLACPLITHIFGIHPDAYNKKVIFKPNLPTGWENISLKNLRVGENSISFSREKVSGRVVYHLVSKDPFWKFVLQIPEKGGNVRVNNNSVNKTGKDKIQNIELSGTENSVIISY